MLVFAVSGRFPWAPGRRSYPRGPILLSSGQIRILMVEQCHEMALELNSCADFSCVLHDFSSRTRLEGSWGPIWPENGRKSAKTKIYILVSD